MWSRRTTRCWLRWPKLALVVRALRWVVPRFGFLILISYLGGVAPNTDHRADARSALLEITTWNLTGQPFDDRLRRLMGVWTKRHSGAMTPLLDGKVPRIEPTIIATAEPQSTTATSASSTAVWPPSSLAPLGTLPDEGQWSPYLHSPDGQAVAYRTVLLADPRRPYSTTTIVAFDLRATRLHFVLGTVEPLPATPEPARTGAIPPGDLRPGVLLSAFNGGFKARPGYYGAMADGIVALPAIHGLATVAIYTDGHVCIGEWGKDILDSPDLAAWRQNGALLIQAGQINPATTVTTDVWGLTKKGEAITWRSALGLSADARTLYYAAGQQLDVSMLTRTMAHTGAAAALQLDVNDGWVHFTAIRGTGASLTAVPLLPAMNWDVDRYLRHYDRDFFYVTAVTAP